MMAVYRQGPSSSDEYDFRPRPSGPRFRWTRRNKILAGISVVLLLGVAAFSYVWFVQRVEVPSGRIMVLVRKVGTALPADMPGPQDQVILYPALLDKLEAETGQREGYKGIVYEPLPEGRYFIDPLFYDRIMVDPVFINQDEVGVLIRTYGKPLPSDRVVATEPNERGPLERVLSPGRHNINPFAYEVRRVQRVEVPEQYVGVVTLLHGDDPDDPNQYVAKAGQRGVQPDVLPPGIYDINPYVKQVELVDKTSQLIELRGDDAIRFPSKDSFEIRVDADVEYAVRQDKAPYVRTAFGNHAAIRDKLILPYAKSLARIEGSKLLAREFISSEMRDEFQKRVFEGLRQECYAQGIEIRATPIREIIPPTEIARPISDRQIAAQEISQFENQIEVASAQADLVEQEEMQKQNQEIGKANREVVTLIKRAEQDKSVALLEAQKRLEVTRLELEAARNTAAAQVARGQADAEVVLLQYEAEARPLANEIAAFGGGESYAQFFFYKKLSPSLKSVLASTDGPFADIFRSLSNAAGGAPSEPTVKFAPRKPMTDYLEDQSTSPPAPESTTPADEPPDDETPNSPNENGNAAATSDGDEGASQ